jgi:hypothetical protein
MQKKREGEKGVMEPRFAWILNPNVSVGIIEFGQPIERYLSIIPLRLVETYDNGVLKNMKGYKVDGVGKIVNVEDGRVASISCDDELFYNGKDLFMMNEQEFIMHIGQNPDKIGTSVCYDDESLQTPFEYYDLGVCAWFEDSKLCGIDCINGAEE